MPDPTTTANDIEVHILDCRLSAPSDECEPGDCDYLVQFRDGQQVWCPEDDVDSIELIRLFWTGQQPPPFRAVEYTENPPMDQPDDGDLSSEESDPFRAIIGHEFEDKRGGARICWYRVLWPNDEEDWIRESGIIDCPRRVIRRYWQSQLPPLEPPASEVIDLTEEEPGAMVVDVPSMAPDVSLPGNPFMADPQPMNVVPSNQVVAVDLPPIVGNPSMAPQPMNVVPPRHHIDDAGLFAWLARFLQTVSREEAQFKLQMDHLWTVFNWSHGDLVFTSMKVFRRRLLSQPAKFSALGLRYKSKFSYTGPFECSLLDGFEFI